MDIFLIRHFESEKNTQITFSSADDLEPLTKKGIENGQIIAFDISMILGLLNLHAENIYCSASNRAIDSARIISATLVPSPNIVPFKELLSTKSKDTVGRTKREVRKTNPVFAQELSLYDAGVFNSYNFHRDIGKKEKIAYESNVNTCIDYIINNKTNENVKLIILHNSSITAAVIRFARQYCQYPNDFYGKIIADNGFIFWIHIDDDRGEFRVANCSSKTLIEIIQEKYVIKKDIL